jgi:tetratricopeptide (TPR) repeat protein
MVSRDFRLQQSYRLGENYNMLEEFVNALPNLQKALTLHEDKTDKTRAFLYQQGFHNTSHEDKGSHPTRAKIHYQLALCHRGLNNPNLAKNNLIQSLKYPQTSEETSATNQLLGNILQSLGKPVEAEDYFQKSTVVHDHSETFHQAEVDMFGNLVSVGKFRKAKEHINRRVSIVQSANTAMDTDQTEMIIEVYWYLGMSHEGLGSNVDALESYSEALEMLSSTKVSENHTKQKIRTLFHLANCRWNTKDFDQSWKEITEAYNIVKVKFLSGTFTSLTKPVYRLLSKHIIQRYEVEHEHVSALEDLINGKFSKMSIQILSHCSR